MKIPGYIIALHSTMFPINLDISAPSVPCIRTLHSTMFPINLSASQMDSINR